MTSLILEERRAALNTALQPHLRSGARIESQTDTSAVLVRGKPVNHILHLILTLVTVGLWLIVWIILTLAGGEKKRLITVDEQGHVSERGA